MASRGKCKSVAFQVEFDDPSPDVATKVPRRLIENRLPKQPLTAEQLEKKLKLAEERRKAYEAAKIRRMKQRQADAERLDRAWSSRMKQDTRYSRAQRRIRSAFIFSSNAFNKKSSGGIAFTIDLRTLNHEPARVPIVLRPISGREDAIENIDTEDPERWQMNSSPVSSPKRPKSVAYMVDFMDDPVSKEEAAARIPERLRKRRTSGSPTAEQLEEKLRLAEKRKKAYEAARIERGKQKQEEVFKIRQACSLFWCSDTDNTRPMNRREAAKVVRDAIRCFGRMNAQMQEDIDKAVALYKDLSTLEEEDMNLQRRKIGDNKPDNFN